jgi:hypothetical protein
MPHIHDPVRVGSVNPDQWIDDVIPLLNREKMLDFDTDTPLSDAELRTVLREMYEGIRTHGLDDKTPGAPGGRSVGNRRTDARILQFKDGDSWMKYSETYGAGDPLDTMVGYVESMGRDIGLMEKFGPNPKHMIAALKDTVAKEQAKDVPGSRRGFAKQQYGKTLARAVDTTYAHLTGSTSTPVNGVFSGIMSAMRSSLSGILLQSSTLSAVTDINGQRIARRMIGMSETKALANIVRNFAGAMPNKQQLALHLSLGSDSWTQTASGAARYTGDTTGPEWSRRFVDFTMRAIGLTPWTQGGKNVVGLDLYHYLHQMSDKAFDQLPKELQSELSRFGIEGDYWDVIRKAEAHEAGNGAKYVNPMNVYNGDAKLGREAATRLQNLELTLQKIAVIEVSPRVKGGSIGETLPGTFQGELSRSFFLFKSFPLTQLHMQVFNAAQSRMGKGGKAMMMANVLIGATVFGALAVQAKQIANGKDPIDMTDPKFWGQAFAQGGGASIMGDFMFADQNRFGKGWWTSLAGPVFDFLDDTTRLTLGNAQEALKGEGTNIGKESLDYVKKYMPFGKFWYHKLAFERTVLDQADKSVDPKANERFQRQMRETQKRTGQQYWWRKGRTSPDRAPDMGAAVGQ